MRRYQYHESTYYGHGSSSLFDEFERVARMQRTPGVISEYPNSPNMQGDYHHRNIFHHQHHRDRAPEIHKKVHFVEHDQIGKDGKVAVPEEKTIDIEADGFIQQKHKSFELCKFDTFKM